MKGVGRTLNLFFILIPPSLFCYNKRRFIIYNINRSTARSDSGSLNNFLIFFLPSGPRVFQGVFKKNKRKRSSF